MFKTHGMYGTIPYSKFRGLFDRCNNPKSKDYKNYGGRGIKCEWKNFEDFWKDMESGYAEDLTIDRINNDGNYSKENCRWITNKEQQSNKRNNVFLTYNGETRHLAFWQQKSNLKKSTFRARYLRGWSIEEIMNIPKK